MEKNIFENKVTESMLNYYRLLHGGEAFKIMDSTAGYVSRNYANGKTVTRAATNIVYHASVYLGETVVSSGEIKKVGRTSLKVYVENRIKERDNMLASSGEFTMVLVDDNFRPKRIKETLLEG